MSDGELSINFYLYNLLADERQRGSHEIVQSRGDMLPHSLMSGLCMAKFEGLKDEEI